MSNQSESESANSRNLDGGASNDCSQLDSAGQTILQLLHKAAGVAEANSKHALDMAQKLLHQLHAAEARIAHLESEVQRYRDKAERAEEWLRKVYTEIEEWLIRQPQEKLQRMSRP
jgi:hypothetical protein